MKKGYIGVATNRALSVAHCTKTKKTTKKNWAVMQKVQCLLADLRRITAVNRSKNKQKSNTTIWIEVEDRMIISFHEMIKKISME